VLQLCCLNGLLYHFPCIFSFFAADVFSPFSLLYLVSNPFKNTLFAHILPTQHVPQHNTLSTSRPIPGMSSSNASQLSAQGNSTPAPNPGGRPWRYNTMLRLVSHDTPACSTCSAWKTHYTKSAMDDEPTLLAAEAQRAAVIRSDLAVENLTLRQQTTSLQQRNDALQQNNDSLQDTVASLLRELDAVRADLDDTRRRLRSADSPQPAMSQLPAQSPPPPLQSPKSHQSPPLEIPERECSPESDLPPNSFPSNSPPPNSKKKKKKKKKKSPALPDPAERERGLQPGDSITVAAYFLGVDADEPRIVQVTCAVEDPEEMGYLCTLANFKEYTQWDHLGWAPLERATYYSTTEPLLPHSLSLFYDDNGLINGSRPNRCVEKLIGGPGKAYHHWVGDFMLFRNESRDWYCDVAEEDLAPAISFFQEYGRRRMV